MVNESAIPARRSSIVDTDARPRLTSRAHDGTSGGESRDARTPRMRVIGVPIACMVKESRHERPAADIDET